jgi:cellulose synthase (UDP-forming)
MSIHYVQWPARSRGVPTARRRRQPSPGALSAAPIRSWMSSAAFRKVSGIVLLACMLVLGARYFSWRLAQESAVLDPYNVIPVVALFCAELFAFAICVMGALIRLHPSSRKAEPLPPDSRTWPSVDVMIATYDEPVALVEATLMAARRIRYPETRIRVYLLDDGAAKDPSSVADGRMSTYAATRASLLRDLCLRAGATYLRRDSNEGAKGGNLNHALGLSRGEYVLVLDADHRPDHDILTKTIGLLVSDRAMAFVQTPHAFGNRDPIERNLGLRDMRLADDPLFHSDVQRGLDSWNAAVFCGTGAVFRRHCLERIGGFRSKTLREDFETSLQLHAAGYRSAFLEEPLATSILPETLTAFAIQRTRWAQGTMQLLLLDNPVFKAGLTLPQRLCYVGVFGRAFLPLTRLIFLLAPAMYLVFGLKTYSANAGGFLSYALPYLACLFVASLGLYKAILWGRVYELVQAFMTAAALGALTHPRGARFRVTPKNERVDRSYLSPLAPPFIILLCVLGASAAFAVWRFCSAAHERDLVLIMAAWNLVNLALAVGAVLAMRERRSAPLADEGARAAILG